MHVPQFLYVNCMVMKLGGGGGEFWVPAKFKANVSHSLRANWYIYHMLGEWYTRDLCIVRIYSYSLSGQYLFRAYVWISHLWEGF